MSSNLTKTITSLGIVIIQSGCSNVEFKQPIDADFKKDAVWRALESGREQELLWALDLLFKNCETNADAQMMLSSCFERGKGVVENKEISKKLMIKAANGGNIRAMNLVANQILLDAQLKQIKNASTPSYYEAVSIYFKIEEAGSDCSQDGLAYCYLNGIVVAKNLSEAYARALLSGNTHLIKRIEEEGITEEQKKLSQVRFHELRAILNVKN